MFRPAHYLIIAAIVAALALSACGGGDDDAPAATVGSTSGVLSTVEVAKTLTPSVVHIGVQLLATDSLNQPLPGGGVGTGVILNEDGYILTNNHVIGGSVQITVTLNTGESYPAELLGGDFQTDLAVLHIDADGLQPAVIGNSSALQIGEDVIAIGHALGLQGGPTVSKGVISALGRSLDTDQVTTMIDLIQTDSAINPGNSGGPLVNTQAEVIGINTAILQGTQGIGFAINIDDATVVASQLIDRGYVDRGFLGISPFNLTPALASQAPFALPVTAGVLVARVIPGGAAEVAGLQEFDVIVKLGDDSISNTGELSKFLLNHLPGETVHFELFRGEDRFEGEVTLGERPQG